MQHEYHRCPVTALAYLSKSILLAGEGNDLNVYQVKPDGRIHSVRVFESQTIHGILVVEHTPLVLVWGGTSLRLLSINGGRAGVDISFGCVYTVDDWILNIAVACGSDSHKAIASLITAHNALWTLKIDVPNSGDEGRVPNTILERAVSGSNCILYSAHIKWLSASHCLVASGTAFGDVILWSAFFDEGSAPQTQVHFTYSAHEGSVFGVQISPLLRLPGTDDERRLLASCSDDRTVRLWDISDLTTESPALSEVQRDTGFGSTPDTDALAPPLLAKVMGHTSRIWHVRFLHQSVLPSDVKLKILSCGEDASANTWEITRSPLERPYQLKLLSTRASHSGKNIWSVAQHDSGVFATGGADGAIACYLSKANLNLPSDFSQSYTRLDKQSYLGTGSKYKDYTFVSRRHIVATTEQGHVLLIDAAKTDGSPVKELSGPLSGLQGYSVMASEIDTAFISGTDGAIYCYAHREDDLDAFRQLQPRWLRSTQSNSVMLDDMRSIASLPDATLLKLDQRAGKTASLLASKLPTAGACLLATSVACRTASLYTLENRGMWPPFENGGLKKRDLAFPHSVVATSLAVCALSSQWYVFVGTRNGSILVYDLGEDLSDDALLQPCQTQSQVHGKEAVTALLGHVEMESDFLFSTGRDGTIAIHRLSCSTNSTGSHPSLRPPPSLHLVHQLSLPFGPNLESLHRGRSDVGSQELLVSGFRGKDFVCYDTSTHRTALNVTCGGPHRTWAFKHHDVERAGGTFVWTQAGKVHCYDQTVQSCRVLDSGGHGREIKAAAVSGKMEHGRTIVATGAEDTDIKLFHLRSDRGGRKSWRCLHTLRKHNTGIQHLAWDGEYLFSSGGFEEFFVWRVTHGVPCLDVGVVCESQHPRSGKSDLRICGFDVRRLDSSTEVEDEDAVTFEVCMAYSDSSLKLWRYTRGGRAWELVSAGDYLTSCLTHALRVDNDTSANALITAATDGHLAFWPAVPATPTTTWTTRHRVHQSAIHALASTTLPDGSALLATGGDDNAIALTRLTPIRDPKTLLLPRAHAAAVTGLAFVPRKGQDGEASWLVSAGIDQRVKLWEVKFDERGAGIDGVEVRRVQSVFTPIADASSLDVCTLEDGGTGVVVCGVGTDVWRLPEGDGDETVKRAAERQ